MEQLIQDTVNFLVEKKDEHYDLFISTITPELVIPKTRTALKNYIIPLYKDLRNANFLIRHFNIRRAEKNQNLLLKNDVKDNFINYFEQEKKCLQKIKSLLKLKSSDCPYISFSGILLVAIRNIHLTNQSKLLDIIETGIAMERSSFDAYIPQNHLTPINPEIIDNINTGLDRVLVKEKKIHK